MRQNVLHEAGEDPAKLIRELSGQFVTGGVVVIVRRAILFAGFFILQFSGYSYAQCTSASGSMVPLYWDASSEPDIDHYNVYRSFASGSGYAGTPAYFIPPRWGSGGSRQNNGFVGPHERRTSEADSAAEISPPFRAFYPHTPSHCYRLVRSSAHWFLEDCEPHHRKKSMNIPSFIKGLPTLFKS